MKIGIVIGSMGFGGAERVTSILSENWVAQSHSVTIYTTMIKPEKEFVLAEGVKRIECNCGGRISTIKTLRQALKKERQDVVLIMDTPMCAIAVPALMGLSIPFIVSERSSPSTKAIKKTTKMVSRFLMNFADGFVFQTNGAKSCYNTRIQKRSIVIPNPIKLNSIPSPYEKERDKRVVAVGRLIPAKNYPILFEAFKDVHHEFEDFILEIYGEGELKEYLQLLIQKLDASKYIKLMGSTDNVLMEIRTAAVYVLSSDIEGMPNALIEAMAMGMPCISTDCPSGGPKDLIENEYNGLLIQKNNSYALSNAIKQLIKNKELSDTISMNAFDIRSRLSIDIIGEKWILFFQRTIDNLLY